MDYLKKILKTVKLYDVLYDLKMWIENKMLFKKRRVFYSQFIKNGDLCFDVGANSGNRTDVFLALGAKVVAIEPQKQCFELLKKKYLDNRDVHLVNKALGEADGEGKIYKSDSSTLASMSKDWITKVEESHRFGDELWGDSEIVAITTLNNLIDKYGVPEFIKIDVEGFESEVLSGLSKSIKSLSFEFASESLSSTKKCIKILSKLGTYRFNYSKDENMEFALNEWLDEDSILELLNQIEDGTWGDIYAKLS